MKTAWFSSFVNELSGESARSGRLRLILASALAIAIMEIVAFIIPQGQTTVSNSPEIVTLEHIVRIAHHAQPTPKPTPKPIVHVRTIAPTHVQPKIVSPAKSAPKQRIKRIARAPAIAHTKYHRHVASVHVPTASHGAGTAKSATALTGSVGTGGNGTGISGNANGIGGAPAATEPCGYVDFEPTNQPTIDQSTGRVWEYVTIVVHFPDGSSQSLPLSYPFYYPSQADDPFVPGHENIPATFQFPPPSQRADQPPLVQYVITHTTPDGYTLLKNCPH